MAEKPILETWVVFLSQSWDKNSCTFLHLRSRLSICYVSVTAQGPGDRNVGKPRAGIYSLMEEADSTEKNYKRQLLKHNGICRQEGIGTKYSKVIKSKNLHPRLFQPARGSFKIDWFFQGSPCGSTVPKAPTFGGLLHSPCKGHALPGYDQAPCRHWSEVISGQHRTPNGRSVL